jgi:hypothetical protein
MSQLLGDVLAKRNYGEPPEIRIIKDFVQSHIGLVPSVSITPESYVVIVPSAAAAGALRVQLYTLQKLLPAKRRVIIRIK